MILYIDYNENNSQLQVFLSKKQFCVSKKQVLVQKRQSGSKIGAFLGRIAALMSA
jgi:hypothetical protein